MAVRIRLGHVVRRPELIRDGDPHAGQRLRAGPHGAVHPCAVVVAEEDDAVLHGRPRVKVRDPFDGPGRDLRLFFLRLVVVHRLPRRRVVRGVGERIVVRGAVDDPPVGEVPRRDGRIHLQGRAEPGDSRVRGVQVLRRVADVRPVEHGVVEGRLVHDCRARNLVARLHELQWDVLGVLRIREDLEEVDRQDAAIGEVQDPVVREFHRRVEDARVRRADGEEPRIHREVSDVPSGDVADGVIQ